MTEQFEWDVRAVKGEPQASDVRGSGARCISVEFRLRMLTVAVRVHGL
ncbi:MAG TPA: hypothetical protein VGW12_20935 [Pyrinomonadaceae bacterium]|nr:hypothetical protein [Pyrinomonadaceae bacterium]